MNMRKEQWLNNTYKEREMQSMYKRNIEARSRNHCYPVERKSITYSECVFPYSCLSYTALQCACAVLYRAFHYVLRDYKKFYYRKTVGHVFTKPIQVEGTTKKLSFPSRLFFIVVHISAAMRCKCM